MLNDLPENIVDQIGIAVCLEESTPDDQFWQVYLVNMKKETITNVLVSSKGYGSIDGKEVKTSVLRHAFKQIEGHEFALIEPIDKQLFGINNEYWISFYLEGVMYDKKYVFVTESIKEENMIPIPLVKKPGVFIV
ncbi:MAG: hypothetical protein ACJAZ3_001171 [Sphingobacteriales bacterium]|jgi:hypothetical protein